VLRDGLVAGGDDEVEDDGLGELDAGGGSGGDLVLVGAGRGEAEVGVGAAAATAGDPERGEGDEKGEEEMGEVGSSQS
jgi:hypothetical protein